MLVRQIVMTPELASKLLEHNTRNRILHPHRVVALAAALSEGRFVPEASSPVVIGADHSVQNGQHRLAATVESGVSWQCILIEDAPEEARLFHDTGKPRSFADYLRQSGVRDPTNIAASTRLIWFYEEGMLETRAAFIRARSTTPPDYARLWNFYQKRQDGIGAALQLARTIRGVGELSRSVAVASAYVLLDVNEEDCRAFYAHLALRGEESMPGQIKALRRSLENLPVAGTRGVPGDQQHQMAVLFKGWNAWRTGDPLEYARWRSGGKAPEKFPVPK